MKSLLPTLLLASLLLTACHTRQNEALVKKSSSGKTCEVLLVADRTVYSDLNKTLLDSILRESQPGLPQSEPRFDVVNVPQSSFRNTAMFQMHRNIIICDVNAENKDKVYISHDQRAAPQVVIEVMATSDTALRRLVRSHEQVIKKNLYAAEHERMRNVFYRDRNVNLMQRFYDKFGFHIVLPQEFEWAKEDGDFVWMRKMTKSFDLHVLVQTSPYRSQDMFTAAKIEQRLDTLMRRYVPGPAEGSYMGIEHRDEVLHSIADYPSSPYCIETRAQWRLHGDFMGGPFVCYSLLSPDKRQVIDVVGFVYCPRFDKRDYLMQVEGICHSITFDE